VITRSPPRPTLFPYTTLFRSYALLQRLRQDSRVDFESERLDRPEDLFRVHFLLFHHLYVLRDELRSTQRGELEIQPLNIRWRLRSEEHTSELQSRENLVCRLL